PLAVLAFPSVPTRRSSDLGPFADDRRDARGAERRMSAQVPARVGPMVRDPKKIGGSDAAAICGEDPNKTAYAVALRLTGQIEQEDRKSTRLNSSHLGISYA